MVEELISRELASTSISTPTLPNLERPANPFAHPDQESKTGVIKGASTSNIIQGKRTRKPAAFTFERLFWEPMNQQFAHYHSSFLAGATFAIPKIHTKDLPPPPKKQRELDTHPYGALFKQDQKSEYATLWDKGTFKSVPIKGLTAFILPLMWVHTYKTDEDGYLTRCKSRLVVRGDLQKASSQDTYAATLAARVFRALMVIAAYFNLDIY